MLKKITGSVYLVLAGVLLLSEETSLFHQDWSVFGQAGLIGVVSVLTHIGIASTLIFFGVKLILSSSNQSVTPAPSSVNWILWVPLGVLLAFVLIFAAVWFFACLNNEQFCKMSFF